MHAMAQESIATVATITSVVDSDSKHAQIKFGIKRIWQN
jgi:ribosomal protein L7Ae-like RNA K-turn-binding protein